MKQICEQVERHRLVPVIALDDVSHADSLADALVAGGLPVAEVTFRTPAALQVIEQMAKRGDLLVGAGTVLSIEQADQAQAAGASFLVSPGFNPKVVSHAVSIDMPIFPGVCTPTEIEQALEHGIEVVKFFPAESFGGLATIKALAGPYRNVRFLPTGGIGPGNVRDYLAFDRVVACGGSWMVSPSLYASGDFDPVRQAITEAVALVKR
jgi:2-dehydro-3-deoxyphosphogluconate aldolase/(4S)-4-hydroxy-2-oxoglutarate aldolase